MVITAASMGASQPRGTVQVLEVGSEKVLRFTSADGTVTDVPHTDELEAKIAKESAFQEAYNWYGGPVAP